MELRVPSFDQSGIHNKRNGHTNGAAPRDDSLKRSVSFALLRCCAANLISACTQKPSTGKYCPVSCSRPSACSGYRSNEVSPLFGSARYCWTLTSLNETWSTFTKCQLSASCSLAFTLTPEGVYPTIKFIFSVM